MNRFVIADIRHKYIRYNRYPLYTDSTVLWNLLVRKKWTWNDNSTIFSAGLSESQQIYHLRFDRQSRWYRKYGFLLFPHERLVVPPNVLFLCIFSWTSDRNEEIFQLLLSATDQWLFFRLRAYNRTSPSAWRVPGCAQRIDQSVQG